MLWVAVCLFAVLPGPLSTQTAAPPSANVSSDEAAMAKLVTLRDAFIDQIKAEGLQPSLAPPTIVLDNPPSFGRYEGGKNVLHIAVWTAMRPEDQARFTRIAGVLSPGKTGEQEFEDAVHRWAFIHELSHWWQAAGQHKAGATHYSFEYGANRIAAAYWRSKDPAFMENTAKRMSAISSMLTDPVPPVQSQEDFFNKNYRDLSANNYRWFHYTMVLNAQAEKPLPTFKQTLQNPIYP